MYMWPPGVKETKSCSNIPGPMVNMAAMPIYVINLKNLLLQNQLTHDLEISYVVLRTQVLPIFFEL